jgi:hypothetical protein
VFDRADAGALRTDEAFTEFGTLRGLDHPDLSAMQQAKRQLLDSSQGVPSAAAVQRIKTTVLGPGGALLDGNIQLAAHAYTEFSAATLDEHFRHEPSKVKQSQQDITKYGSGGGGDVTSVVAPTRGFTDLKGDRAAVYEMREREIRIDRTGRFNIGSLTALYQAIDGIFGAAE